MYIYIHTITYAHIHTQLLLSQLGEHIYTNTGTHTHTHSCF